MPHETLDYRSIPPVMQKRFGRLVAHAITAAGLCLVAVWVDRKLRFDGDQARHLPWIELGLVVYGLTFAVISIPQGGLKNRGRIALIICLVLFMFTVYVAVLMPRVTHN